MLQKTRITFIRSILHYYILCYFIFVVNLMQIIWCYYSVVSSFILPISHLGIKCYYFFLLPLKYINFLIIVFLVLNIFFRLFFFIVYVYATIRNHFASLSCSSSCINLILNKFHFWYKLLNIFVKQRKKVHFAYSIIHWECLFSQDCSSFFSHTYHIVILFFLFAYIEDLLSDHIDFFCNYIITIYH